MRGGRLEKIFQIVWFFVFLNCFAGQVDKVRAEWDKVNTNIYLTSVETSPWGILVGEFDTRIWLNPPPLNDIYLSKDFGQNWIPLGLTGRGIKDLKYFDGKIYAATYYVRDSKNGLFVTEDFGKNWQQVGPMFSLSKVNRDTKTIYMGSENRGLWVSQDEGANWTQKIGSAGFGPDIRTIESFEDITFVATPDKVYKSIDYGTTWNEVIPLNNKDIAHFCKTENIIFAGSSGTLGAYKSSDNGVTWTKINSLGNDAIGDLVFYEGKLFAAKINPNIYDTYTVYVSEDFGSTWTDTKLNIPSAKRITDISWTFFNPYYLYAVSLNYGLFKYLPEKPVFETLPFLEIPWKNSQPDQLIDKITSFFDHKYPLLGYDYFSEPAVDKNTTLNFYGDERAEPEMYYSSHNGTDYGLSYGTEITASAGGTASNYYCPACGNSIKITHPNGYQSVYMHLQKTGLAVTNGQVLVNTGDTIGKVGMTGNTNGPHLHFEIIKDGLYPDKLTDPYGWLTKKFQDPWEIFSWEDYFGTHHGTKSVYLWKSLPTETTGLVGGSNGLVALSNKSVSWNNSSGISGIVYLQNYFQPNLPKAQGNLSYVENSSILINAYDFLGKEILNFSDPLEITISFSNSDLSELIPESIKVYCLDNVLNLWVPLPTILDLVSKTATAQTNHLSNFALLAQKADSSPPVTTLDLIGAKSGNWFIEYPTLTLTAKDPESSPTNIFYTTGGESEWEEYFEPITMSKEGIFELQFRSIDQYENLEPTQTYIVSTDTQNRVKKTVRIKGTSFTTN